MSGDSPPETQATGMAGDTKVIIRSIIATGIGLATLLLMLAGLMVQQNAGLNDRIDDLNARIDDVNTSVNARIGDVNASVNARIDDVNRRMDDMQQDIRDLRTLIIDALKRTAPAG